MGGGGQGPGGTEAREIADAFRPAGSSDGPAGEIQIAQILDRGRGIAEDSGIGQDSEVCFEGKVR